MGGSMIILGWPLGIAVAALLTLAVSAAAVQRLGTARSSLIAATRAVVQLAVVSATIAALVRSWWGTAVFVLLMFGVASWTSARRITRDRSGLAAAGAVGAGTVPVLIIVLGTGAVPLTGIAVVPVAGIVIGGAMTATSVAGRSALEQLATRSGEHEAALALGFPERDAAMLVIRRTAADALVPVLDQTRTVGLVTLPGAFVGVLLGSGDPVRAGAAQVLVLIGLVAAETLAVLVAVELVARSHIRPAAEA